MARQLSRLSSLSALSLAYFLLNALIFAQEITFCSLSLDIGPTGQTTTNIASNASAVLTIIQTLSFISCTSQTASVNPWAYIGSPNSIVSGQVLTVTVGPYATTFQTTVLTQIYPTVSLETVLPTVVVWNEPIVLGPISGDVDPGIPESTSFTLIVERAAVTITVTGGNSSPSSSLLTTTPLTTSSQSSLSPAIPVGLATSSAASQSSISQSSTSQSVSAGAIAGIAVGSVIGGILLGALGFLLYIRSKKQEKKAIVDDGPVEMTENVVMGQTDTAQATEMSSGRLRYLEDNQRDSGNLAGS